MAEESERDQLAGLEHAIGSTAEDVESMYQAGMLSAEAADRILVSLRGSGLAIDAAIPLRPAAYRLITDTGGTRHLVDGAGVRYFTEDHPGYWYTATEAGNWAAWQGIAAALRATPEPAAALMCPGGCGCRLGTADAGRRECGCDGGCCGG